MATTEKKAEQPKQKSTVDNVALMNKARKDRGITGGRPTVATDEMIALAMEYANGGWVNHKLQSGRSRVFPTTQGLALYLGIHVDSLYANTEFSEVIKTIKEFQHEELTNGSASGALNPLISKLMLSSKHGYVEKTATEADNRNVNLDVTELSDEDLDAKLAKLKSV